MYFFKGRRDEIEIGIIEVPSYVQYITYIHSLIISGGCIGMNPVGGFLLYVQYFTEYVPTK